MRDPSTIPGLISAFTISDTRDDEEMDQAPPEEHTQESHPVDTSRNTYQHTQTWTRHPDTGRRIRVPQTQTLVQTTPPTITTQRVTRSQTQCATLQLQSNTALMDIDAANSSISTEATQVRKQKNPEASDSQENKCKTQSAKPGAKQELMMNHNTIKPIKPPHIPPTKHAGNRHHNTKQYTHTKQKQTN